MLMKSIREASSPLRNAGGFLGIYLFDYKKFYFNHLYMLAIWTLYACTIIRSHILLFGKGQFTTIVGILTLNSSWIFALVTLFYNAIYKETSERCFKALCIVDDTLKSLGVSLEYRTIYRDSLITLILIVLVSVGSTLFSSIPMANFNSLQHVLCIIMMYVYPYFLTTISDFHYWIVLRSIENRFHQLNQYINDLSADRGNHGRTFPKSTCFILKSRKNDNSKNDQSKVWIIMKLHWQLKKTSRDMNRIFGVEFGMQMGVYFFVTIEVISSLYLIYIESTRITMNRALLMAAYIIGHLVNCIKIILMNCICENIQRKSNTMGTVLTNFINTVHDPESWQEIHQFLMQVKHRPLQFTALGFISLGYKCLASMFTTITETVIIMVQLGGMAHASYVHPEYNTTIND